MKVTAEVYKNIKKGKAPAQLSKRTIRNVEKSLNYADYRKRYCEKKKITIDGISTSIVNMTEGCIEDYYLLSKKQRSELYKILMISLLVNVIGFTVLIAMIAW